MRVITFSNFQLPDYLIVVTSIVFILLLQRLVSPYIKKLALRLRPNEHDRSDLVISQITHILIAENEIDALIGRLLGTLKAEFKIKGVAIMLFGPYLQCKWSADGLTTEQPKGILTNVIHQALFDAVIVGRELPEGNLRSFFLENNLSVTFPIKIKNQPIAILLFGAKQSEIAFTGTELTLAELLASEMGMGLQNAIAFAGIRHFNEELEQNVLERTNELVKSQKEEIEKANEVARLKDEFVFLASHELRTPITAIRGFLELTLDAKVNFPKDIRENLETMQQASDHLNQLVNDLLEIARNEGGKLSIVSERNELHLLVEYVVRELQPLINEKKITLHEDLKNIPAVYCDSTKTKEVLLNLVGNAIKYGREGGNIYISVFRVPNEAFALIEILDDGFGIPKDQQGKIFQKFFRAGTHGTEDTLGTGLGLFITRMLVEKMGGEIMFTSNEQKGSTFSFTLPLVV